MLNLFSFWGNKKNKIETGNIKMNIIKTLQNGTKVVENCVTDELQVCQEILDINPTTSVYDAWSAFNERPENNFEYTYIVKVQRQGDYKRFLEQYERETGCVQKTINKEIQGVRDRYYNDDINWQTMHDTIQELEKKDNTCHCSKCQFVKPTFEEWKTGKYSERGMKLGKTMRKAGFSQQLLDFYSMQIKTEKELCLTVTSAPQFIAGMSYYCKLGTWDGFQGSSCQDVRHDDEEYCKNLGGALHDDKLFIGMLHENVDDLEDFEDKMLARTLFRYIKIDNEPLLVALEYYGNNTTKSELAYALNELNEVNIFSTDLSNKYNSYGEIINHKEKANGSYEYEMCDEVNVDVTIDEYVSCDCPMCEGSGDYEVFSDRLDKHVEISCPMCGGSGTYEVNVYEEIDEWIEVEDTKEILPYIEGYSHNGYNIEIQINIETLKATREKFKATV
ncbi:putative DnaJ domain-containing protein [Bacillus phage Izhevsk]|uniref:Putative DnaJ domain-containing protein n=1 Tax=Bacillus phage Izhevsk TaxID=2724322 RepID=A0A6H0X5W8_9CAUD|nr:putative DnaJ domain-containing protein [Bacillus phage Izhevsk]QIW89683.1 putative DnaJ domain-containing protein [Bacillus phage Izhevsk]